MVGEIAAEAAANGLAAIGQAMAKPVVIEFGGDGLHLYGRKRGKTDNRCLLKRLEVPAWLVVTGAAAGAVAGALALGKVADLAGLGDGPDAPPSPPPKGPGEMIVEALLNSLRGIPAADVAANIGLLTRHG